jgi:hypothetical protein
VVDERLVDLVAAEHNISLRTGCFCNPGAGEVAFSISKQRLAERFEEGMILDDYIGLVGMPTGGAAGPRSASRPTSRMCTGSWHSRASSPI